MIRRYGTGTLLAAMLDAQQPLRGSLRAVAFDLDGTLADSAPGICCHLLDRADRGRPPDFRPRAEIAAMIGLPLADIMVRYRARRLERRPRSASHPLQLDLHHVSRPRDAPVSARLVAPAGLPSGGARAGDRDWQDDRRGRGRPQAVPNSPLFKTVVGNDRASAPEAVPGSDARRAGELGVPAEQTLLVGDAPTTSRWDAAPACATCGVAWGVHDVERLTAAGADHVVHSMAELRDLILGPPPPSLPLSTLGTGMRRMPQGPDAGWHSSRAGVRAAAAVYSG